MGIANIINNSTTTSGGEIIRELVNSSDGQGLHFDGSAGGINLGSSMPDLGTKYSLEFVVKGDSKTGETYLLDAYKSGARIIFGWSGYSNGNIQLHINGTWSSAFMATPDNGQVVHLVLSVDGTSATLYQNGNSASTQTVVANTMTSATSTHIGCSQNGTANYFNGTIYRARFYNKALTSAEVQTAFERADVDFADQYGRQTLTDGNFPNADNWAVNSTGSGWSIGSNKATFTQTGSIYGAITQTGVFTSADVGKKVHVTFEVETATAAILIGNNIGNVDYVGTSYAAYTVGQHTVEFTMPSGQTTFGFWSNGATFSLKNASIHVEGSVVDLDLAFANPTQSLTVQDRSTNNVDGTASSSTAVTQVQKLVQVNATSARIGTVASAVADGTLAIGNKQADAHSDANELIIATSAGSGGMTINTANNAGGSIYFADGTSGDDLYRGYVVYNHSSNLMALGTDALTRLVIDSGGRVHVGSGTASQVNLNVTGTSGNGGVMQNALTSGHITNGTNLGSYGFKGTDSANSNGAAEAKITAVAAATHTGTSAPTDLVFFTKPSTSGPGNSPTERMRISSTGVVGLSVTPEAWQSTRTALQIGGNGSLNATSAAGAGGHLDVAQNAYINSSGSWSYISTDEASLYNQVAGKHNFKVAASGTADAAISFTTAMVINNNANVLVGCTDLPDASVEGVCLTGSNSGQRYSSGSATTAYNHAVFYNGNGIVGTISTSGSATAYNTSSDYRLKENLEPLTGALDRLDALPVYRFNFKADPDTTVDGFVAHEVSAHVPEAVTGEKDAMKTVVVQEAVEAVEAQPATYWEEGDELPEGVAVGDVKTAAVEAVEAVAEVTEEQPDYQGIDQSKLVPLLVAAVKELKAKVETLENA